MDSNQQQPTQKINQSPDQNADLESPDQQQISSSKKIKSYLSKHKLMVLAIVLILFLVGAATLNYAYKQYLIKYNPVFKVDPIRGGEDVIITDEEDEGISGKLSGGFYLIKDGKLELIYEAPPKDLGDRIISDDLFPYTQNGKYIYFLEDNKVFKYSIPSRAKELQDIKPTGDNEITFLQYEPPYLYVADGIHAEDNIYANFRSLSLETQEEVVIGDVRAPVYGLPNYLFKSNDGSDIISARGGDGCGRNGMVLKYVNGESEELAKTYSACNREAVILIGHSKKLDAIFTTEREGHPTAIAPDIPDDFEPKYTQIIMLNVLNNEQKSIFDLSSYDIVGDFVIDDENSLIYILTKDKLLIYDINSDKIIEEVQADINKEFIINGETYFLYEGSFSKLNKLNADRFNEIYTESWPRYLGNYNDMVLIKID